MDARSFGRAIARPSIEGQVTSGRVVEVPGVAAGSAGQLPGPPLKDDKNLSPCRERCTPPSSAGQLPGPPLKGSHKLAMYST